MKTKIKYESFKRAKEIISVKKAYEKYAKEIDEPMELQLYDSLDRFFNKEIIIYLKNAADLKQSLFLTL